jgi:hypothetical protein
MANSDKNILITPATGTSGDPRIVYTPNTAANVITQRLTDSGTLSFEGSAGQLFSITNSLTGTLFSVNDISGIPSIDVADTGLVRIAPFSGTLAIGSTAVVTSGGVSAKGSITTTATTQPGFIVKGIASQSANLLEIQNSSGTVLSRFASTGQLLAPSIVGTAFQITSGGVFSNGTTSAIANTQAYFLTTSATNAGLVVRGASSQTADLLELQNSSAADLFSVNASGGVLIGTTHLGGATPGLGQIRTSSDTGLNYVDTTANATASTGPGYTARRARGTLASPAQVQSGDLLFGIFAQGYNDAGSFSGNSAAIRMLANQNFTSTAVGSNIVFETVVDGSTTRSERMRVTGTGTLSVGTTSSLAQLGVVAASASTVVAAIRGASSQSANLQEWQDNSGNILLAITSSGGIGTSGLTAIRPEANRNVALAANLGSYGGGQAVVFLGNAAAAPSSSPTGGGLLFVDSGALKYRGTSGSTQNIVSADGTISFTGSVTASEKLQSTNSSGDEGGEIFLNKSATNTTLTGGVTIDVWQNRLRFFEQGGDARGFYIDISTGGNGVGTNLVGGGSASNSFATISTPSGTSPVADSSTDTLTLTAGTGITITGDSSADSIAIATNATSANTVSAIVTRDASGNFSAGTITAATFSGSGASLTNIPAANVTGTLTSTVLGNSALFIGTTSVALNRTTGNLALTGITSITGGTGTTDLDFFTANTSSANSGAIDILTGTTTTSGTTGLILIRSGNSAAASGGVTVSTGTSTATTSGTLTLSTGNASGTGGTSGAISIATGAAGSTGNSGAITMDVGTRTSGSFGTITIGGTNASAITVGNATNTATTNLVSSTSVNLNSPAINSNAATLALLATPATITMGAAVTTLTIAGTSTANVTANLATGVTTGSKVVNIGTSSSGGSTTVTIGSTSGSSTVTINGTIAGTPADATTATATTGIGYRGLPQNSTTTGSYTLVAADAGRHIFASATRTVTIPANGSVAFPIGTAITFIAGVGATMTIAITTDTMYLAGAGTTGSRTLAAHGIATAVKTTSTTWIISGNGLT